MTFLFKPMEIPHAVPDLQYHRSKAGHLFNQPSKFRAYKSLKGYTNGLNRDVCLVSNFGEGYSVTASLYVVSGKTSVI